MEIDDNTGYFRAIYECEKLKEFLDNKKYVFIPCRKKWIVVAEKLSDTLTSENRPDVVFAKYAKLRADKLKVIHIFNKLNPNQSIRKISKYPWYQIHKKDNITFIVDSMIHENLGDKYLYDGLRNRNYGLFYFNSLTPAFFFNLHGVNTYSGKLVIYRSSGHGVSMTADWKPKKTCHCIC